MKRLFIFVIITAVLSAGHISAGVWDNSTDNVYWGDLHIHTQYSLDAYMGGMSSGRFIKEASQYAKYCAKLDFYAVTDHAETLTRKDYWPDSINTASEMNKIGASNPDSNGDPGIVAFTGWEWTQLGPWGHKNVILKWDDAKKLPPSPIRSYFGTPGLADGALEKTGLLRVPGEPADIYSLRIRDMLEARKVGRTDLKYLATTPEALYSMLHRDCLDTGSDCDALVIPHGNAWGNIPLMYTYWDVQLDARNHDPELQRLVEVYSKHGNSEEYKDMPPDYRYYRDGVEETEKECSVPVKPKGFIGRMSETLPLMFMDPDAKARAFRKPLPGCEKICQEPNENYKPCCWRAGEIVAERCLYPGSEWCNKQIDLARRTVKPFSKHVPLWKRGELKPEFRKHPGKTETVDWETCGQCRTCWQPAYNYIAGGSVQKALAMAYFDADGNPQHYRFGFIGSTDSHKAWGGSVKETKQLLEPKTQRASQISHYYPDFPGWERAVNFLNPGGLVAIVSPHRNRDDLWDAMKKRHVYSTSGPRLEVLSKVEVQTGGALTVADMGDEIKSASNPTFHIRANGAFEEDTTCPYNDEPEISKGMSRDEFFRVCLNQCYRVTDKRVSIARMEVIKILQPMTAEETQMKKLTRSSDNPKGLIMDPYHVADVSGTSIEWTWTDEAFESEPTGRSVAYYFRIIQEPTHGYNCNPAYILESGRTCDAYSPNQLDVEKKTNPQDGSKPMLLSEIEDTCYTDVNDPKTYCKERAWTSPFYIIRE